MNVECVKPDALTIDHIDAWRDLQGRSKTTTSPFFSPSFTIASASVQANIEIAIVKDSGAIVGFLPFQRRRFSAGWPVAWKLNDFHGGIFDDDAKIDGEELIRQAGLAAWHFDHLLATQDCFRTGQIIASASPYVDLSDGFDAYLEERKRARSDEIRQTLRKSRKLAREHGGLHFEFSTKDNQVFDTLLDWKQEQLKARKKHNHFQSKWARDLLARMQLGDNEDCRGALSALYAGDQLVAVHFGIHNRHALHWWVNAYNKDFSRYSPGSILLLELTRHAAAEGIQRIDLGKGDEQYKRRFQSDAIELAEGAVSNSAWRRSFNSAIYRAKHWIRSSPVRGLVQWPKRVARRIAKIWEPAEN